MCQKSHALTLVANITDSFHRVYSALRCDDGTPADEFATFWAETVLQKAA